MFKKPCHLWYYSFYCDFLYYLTDILKIILQAHVSCFYSKYRLTFWLSNSVVLRTIISQTIGDTESKISSGQHTERKGNKIISSSLKWKEVSPSRKGNKNGLYEDSSDWEDPHVFTSALERVEAWIFSRTIESIWWQVLH